MTPNSSTKTKKNYYTFAWTQGQGEEWQGDGGERRLSLLEASSEFKRELGDCCMGVYKNGKPMSFKSACKEFNINHEIAERIIELKMEVNCLYGQLERK
jgi:hypothetical protein